MLSYDSYARILHLKRPEDKSQPWLVFVGVRVHEDLSTKLYMQYRTKTLLCDPKDLPTINSCFSSHFIFGTGAFQHPDTFEHLWRVAKEGAHVVILTGMKIAGVVETKPDIKNPQEYGLLALADGTCTDWPYQEGIIRRDLAKHFRR